MSCNCSTTIDSNFFCHNCGEIKEVYFSYIPKIVKEKLSAAIGIQHSLKNKLNSVNEDIVKIDKTIEERSSEKIKDIEELERLRIKLEKINEELKLVNTDDNKLSELEKQLSVLRQNISEDRFQQFFRNKHRLNIINCDIQNQQLIITADEQSFKKFIEQQYTFPLVLSFAPNDGELYVIYPFSMIVNVSITKKIKLENNKMSIKLDIPLKGTFRVLLKHLIPSERDIEFKFCLKSNIYEFK